MRETSNRTVIGALSIGAAAAFAAMASVTASDVDDAVGYRFYRPMTPRRTPRRRDRHGGAKGRGKIAKSCYGRTFKGSSDAKRAARLAAKRRKAAKRPGRVLKWRWACAHGMARGWYARWERGMPVNFTFAEAADSPGVYPRACRLLLKRLGPAYAWSASPHAHVVQLEGPPSPIRPLPMMRRTRSA